MNFQGKEAISRPTRATGRTVLFLALLLGLAGLGWIEVTQNPLFGLKIVSDKFDPLLKLLCLLASIAHVVQWYGDFVSYRGWNVTGGLSGASRWGEASKTKLYDAIEEASKLTDAGQEYQELHSKVDSLSSQLDELHWNMGNFSSFAKFYVYFWHLALPLSTVLVAFLIDHYA